MVGIPQFWTAPKWKGRDLKHVGSHWALPHMLMPAAANLFVHPWWTSHHCFRCFILWRKWCLIGLDKKCVMNGLVFQVFAHAESISMLPKLPFLTPYDVHVYDFLSLQRGGLFDHSRLRNWWASSGRWFFGRGHGRELVNSSAPWVHGSSRDEDVESALPHESPEMRVPSLHAMIVLTSCAFETLVPKL